MRDIRTALTVATMVLAASASAASAQIGLAAAGGPTVALGALGDAVDMGYHAQLSASLSVPLLPLSARVDAMFNQFPQTGVDHNVRMLSGSVNAILSIPSILITPYLIGGVGAYRSSGTAAAGSSTDFGANLGGGLRLGLPGLSVFGEARVHSLFNEGDATRFAPISLGIRF